MTRAENVSEPAGDQLAGQLQPRLRRPAGSRRRSFSASVREYGVGHPPAQQRARAHASGHQDQPPGTFDAQANATRNAAAATQQGGSPAPDPRS